MRVETVNRRPIGPWDEVPVDIHRHLDRAVAELLLHLGERFALLNEQTRVGVP